MRRFLIFCGITAFVVLYFLTLSTDVNSRFASYFWLLASLAGVLALCLFVVITRYIWLILCDKKNHVFGSQIARRLSFMFMLVAIVPALFLLGVSTQFIAHSIGSWFGNDTKEALERSLNLSKTALDASVKRSSEEATIVRTNIITIAQQQADISPALNIGKAQQFNHLALWNITQAPPTLIQERNNQHLPEPELDSITIEKILKQQNPHGIESIQGRLYAHGWLMLPEKNGQKTALFFRQPIPERIAKDAELIESARAKYAELVFAQKGLQTFFLVTLVVAALLAIMLALAAALYFARRFVEPILLLASAARAVAQGDFSQRIHVNQKDELGKLTSIFNNMTHELAQAKAADEQHRIAQEAARHYLERVLNSLSTGVITLNASGSLKTFNQSATQLLDIPLKSLLGETPESWFNHSPQHHALTDLYQQFLTTEHADTPIEIAYTAQDEVRIFLGKAIRLPEENGSGLVIVFDDITQLVRAQKEAAWGEVAKRLAHEIRNPLTPIQLSAERLAWKLHDKLDCADAQILVKSTDTIVKQVAALKEMVEAFRNYARNPTQNLIKFNLNVLIDEVLMLYENTNCTFSKNLTNLPLWIHADATAIRQVLHNLFKNASEAAESDKFAQVVVSTHLKNNQAHLMVCNNGKGFSKSMLQNAFEPYVTDKPTGTGLGLSVVKKIIEEHGGHIHLANQAEGGACVSVILPLSQEEQSDNQ